MKKRVLLIAGVLFSLLLINFVSAEIMLSQPKAVYSINDVIDVSANVKVSSGISDFLKLTLKCGDKSNDFYLSPLSLAAGKEEKIQKNLILSKSFLNDMKGDCKIEAKYANGFASTQSFKISDEININLNIDSLNVKPKENIILKGTAVKANSQNVDGFLEISVENSDIKLTRSVTGGKIEANFSFPENTKSGSYNLQVKVYEKSGEDIGNIGTKNIFVNLRQEPSKIEIVIDKQSVKPGETLKFKPLIYDQANDELQGDVKIEVKDSYDEVYLKKLVKSGEEVTINLGENSSAGYWKIEASYLSINSKRLFYIEEQEKASFEILNDTLIITNTGNVPYKKAVQIAIGNEVEIREMDLEVGESQKFRLLAPDGKYTVSVSDGTETLNLDNIALTGNVIGIEDIRNQIGLFNRYPIVWLFLIVILALFLVVMVQRVAKKKFYGYHVESRKEMRMKAGKEGKVIEVRGSVKAGKEDRMREEKGSIEKAGFQTGKVKEAEHSLILHGNKENASILSLRIKNMQELKGKRYALESIEKALSSINEHKGTLYKAGENLVGIFSPSITKTFKNDLAAIKVASEISRYLQENNKKFSQKIDFGIGINSGDIISRVEKDKFKFTALGNTINLARKIAEKADKDVLLSQTTNNKVMAEVKTEKTGEFYSIKRIVEREQHKKFIEGFLKRSS